MNNFHSTAAYVGPLYRFPREPEIEILKPVPPHLPSVQEADKPETHIMSTPEPIFIYYG